LLFASRQAWDDGLQATGFRLSAPSSRVLNSKLSGINPVTKLPQSAALIVVDVQQAFLDPRFGERNNPQAESNIARLLAAWRDMGLPVRHVIHDSVEPNSLLRPGLPGNAIQAAAAPKGDEPVYRKNVNSAFIGTSLEKDLRQHGIDTLVVVGLTTNHCVSTTVRMAGNLGFTTFVVSDATAAYDRAALDGSMRPAEVVHSGALSDLHGEFATVVNTAEVLRAVGK
jgi:nicotinamidase-related amidase